MKDIRFALSLFAYFAGFPGPLERFIQRQRDEAMNWPAIDSGLIPLKED